ncbi:RNA-binding transcriptional accessory protein [bacterium]|nr:RNA-binding transcriptional accessory protein [bacterium]
MTTNHISTIARELKLGRRQIEATAALLKEGSTVPFIARYRKEATGSLDEVAIVSIRDRLEQLEQLDKRREAILQSLLERELLTEELKKAIDAAQTMAELEDIYLPYKPKRRTRASIAKEKGLEPLASLLFLNQENEAIDPLAEAAKFVDEEKNVSSVDEALAGARDIIAEMVSEDRDARRLLRDLFLKKATLKSQMIKGKEIDGAKFKDYFDWEELAKDAPSHRILALLRGEREKYLSLHVQPPREEAESLILSQFVLAKTRASEQVAEAARDSIKRLLGPSMENEFRSSLKLRADDEAIKVFADNLRELLLASPLGQKRVLALDPGFRTGCKLACLNEQGDLLVHDVIYPHSGDTAARAAGKRMTELCRENRIEAIAIGNGTASRETEAFVRGLELSSAIPIVVVSESGASIYSTSEIARAEFPDYDATVRGAISIGRRLMDPLSELVKVDPKSIGVGQYQHDVDQAELRSTLDEVVISCVNKVGVDLNTASRELLSYVSGLGPQLAQNIVEYRAQNGAFSSRKQLSKVRRLGPKAFEQAAGFLRIQGAKHPLDSSGVHPESYRIVDKMAVDCGCTISELMKEERLRKKIEIDRYVSATIGLPTLSDILKELAAPGRDPRMRFEVFSFKEGIMTIGDLEEGMQLPGIVTNVTAFGAFVDIGVRQDGLVHISNLADRFVKNPADIVKAGQHVLVTVLAIDVQRRRISLSMKNTA